MTISMYKASVPIFVQFLTSLSAWLDKAAAHAEAKKIDPAVLLTRASFRTVSAGAAGAGGDRSRDQRLRTPRRCRAADFRQHGSINSRARGTRC
jgi:hypothetical protein